MDHLAASYFCSRELLRSSYSLNIFFICISNRIRAKFSKRFVSFSKISDLKKKKTHIVAVPLISSGKPSTWLPLGGLIKQHLLKNMAQNSKIFILASIWITWGRAIFALESSSGAHILSKFSLYIYLIGYDAKYQNEWLVFQKFQTRRKKKQK